MANNDYREMVKQMKKLATKMHNRDTSPRKVTGAPYITHPAKVVRMLKSWGYDPNDMEDATTLAIAWGHDLLEDTKVTEAEIAEAAELMPSRILSSIRMLSFLPREGLSGTAKDAAKSEYIKEIGLHAFNYALVVKIADRLCNTLDFCEIGDGWAKEYLKLGEPLFERIDECKGAEKIRETIQQVREKVARTAFVDFPHTLPPEELEGFTTTERGCTHPRMGVIGGRRYIAKCGSWSAYSSDKHVKNEFVADNILRACGFNVPFSRKYKVDFGDGLGEQVVRLAVVEETEPIMAVWEKADEALKAKIRAQVLASYPVQALIAGIDTFTYDNVRVDKNGGLWFVDNGASFNYRACGNKKGWFWDREDVNDPMSGYLSLAHHPDQHDLRTLLGGVTDDQLWQEARKWKFSRIVSWLPEKWQREGLVAYAKAMDRAVKAMGGRV